VAAAGFALASVAQYRASQSLSKDLNLRISLIGKLLKNAEFLKGALFDIIGVIAQFFALAIGPISIVQPILAMGLAFALGIEHKLAGRRFRLLDIIASVITTLSLAYFVVLRGTKVNDHIQLGTTLTVSVSVIVLDLSVVLLGKVRKHTVPQLIVVVAAALSLGCGSVLEREVGISLHKGVLHTALFAPTWVLILLAPISLLLVQSAFQLGSLKAVLPTLTVGEPTAALLLGASMLGEGVMPSKGFVQGIAALLVMAVSLLYLAVSESRFRESVSRGEGTKG
jgi:ABC-type multidrug transport system permease subunit